MARSLDHAKILKLSVDLRPPQRQLSPELRLLLAVLENGLDILRGKPASEPALAEAREWIWSAETEWPFAFLPLCEALGFDPAALRTATLAQPAAAHVGPWRTVLDDYSRNIGMDQRKRMAAIRQWYGT